MEQFDLESISRGRQQWQGSRGRQPGLGVSTDTRAGLVAPPARPAVRACQPLITGLWSRQQLPAPLGLQQTQVETLTGYSTSALARLISSLKASFPAQHPALAIPSAFPNAMQTAQGSLVTRPAQEGN